jgi:SAM-dependent methyltransferase
MGEGGDGHAAFDQAAETYDQEMKANPSMRYMRGISLATLKDAFSASQRVLEIGCGTGEEALALARAGVRVLATDPSAKMLAVTERRLVEEGLEDWEYGERSFDGAYSSFGPLNGESSLQPVAVALAALIRPRGLLVASVMNRFHMFEAMWYLAHARPGQAVRRWGGQSQAKVSTETSETMRTWYYTPGYLARTLAPYFELTYCRALPFLLPPPYLTSLWDKHPRFWERMAVVEEQLAPRWPFRGLGDHFLMILRRSGAD